MEICKGWKCMPHHSSTGTTTDDVKYRHVGLRSTDSSTEGTGFFVGATLIHVHPHQLLADCWVF